MSSLTQEALANTLKSMLETYRLKDITITELVERCGVNRQTFYYHFKDIYDLLHWILEHDAEKIIGSHRTSTNWQEGYCEVLHYILNNKTLVEHIYCSVGREHVERYLHRVVYELLYRVVEEETKALVASEDAKDYIAHFYKYAFVGLTLDWINHGMKSTPDDIVSMLSKLIQGDFKRGVKRLSSNI